MTCIDRFLDAITSGNGIPADLDADGANLDADVVFCGGRWDAAALAEMAEADR